VLHSLWKESWADANSIFLGFLALKPKYDELQEAMRQESYQRRVYEVSKLRPLEILLTQNEALLSKIIDNKIAYSDVSNVKDTDPDTLVTAFRLLPNDTVD